MTRGEPPRDPLTPFYDAPLPECFGDPYFDVTINGESKCDLCPFLDACIKKKLMLEKEAQK